MKSNLFLFIALLTIAACQPKSSGVDYAVDPYNREVVVNEVMQTSSYSYLQVTENNEQYWMAVTFADVKKGSTYYFSEVMEMNDFYSKELDRNFESIFFVGNLSDKPIPAQPQTMQSAPQTGIRPEIQKQDLSIEPVDGSISLAELYERRSELNGQTIKVVGQVAKFNPGIMSRNWVHIQDGTGTEEFFDLTVTTQDMVSPGDIILFEGKITLQKDFGSGYYYEILMEEAKASKLSLQ
ncbi:MAG: GW dipeptide domain-containing protein [Bacteroidales bacterium]|nr:GW dipeptide domain-containing protein [Bacteroidales bacterium]